MTDVTDAIKLLAEHDISALPVLDDDGDLVGILSEADLLPRAEDDEHRHPWWVEALMPARKLAQEFAKAHGKKVGEVMSTDVITASEDTPVSEIAALLERHRIKRVPIVANGRKVVGIVSRSNLIQALASSEADARPEARIRSRHPSSSCLIAWDSSAGPTSAAVTSLLTTASCTSGDSWDRTPSARL